MCATWTRLRSSQLGSLYVQHRHSLNSMIQIHHVHRTCMRAGLGSDLPAERHCAQARHGRAGFVHAHAHDELRVGDRHEGHRPAAAASGKGQGTRDKGQVTSGKGQGTRDKGQGTVCGESTRSRPCPTLSLCNLKSQPRRQATSDKRQGTSDK